jgi:hypothetical protein
MPGAPASAEIEVTPAMLAAGKSALLEHSFSDDLFDVIEDVFRAMAYARADAASTRADI